MTDRRKSISQMITSVFQKPDKDVMADEVVAVPEDEHPVHKSSLDAAARSHVRYDTQSPLATRTEGVKSHQPEHVRSMLDLDETGDRGHHVDKDIGGDDLPHKGDAARHEISAPSRDEAFVTQSGKSGTSPKSSLHDTRHSEVGLSGHKDLGRADSKEDRSELKHSTTNFDKGLDAPIHIPGQWDTLKGEERAAPVSSTTHSTEETGKSSVLPEHENRSSALQQNKVTGEGFCDAEKEKIHKDDGHQKVHNVMDTKHPDLGAEGSHNAPSEAEPKTSRTDLGAEGSRKAPSEAEPKISRTGLGAERYRKAPSEAEPKTERTEFGAEGSRSALYEKEQEPPGYTQEGHGKKSYDALDVYTQSDKENKGFSGQSSREAGHRGSHPSDHETHFSRSKETERSPGDDKTYSSGKDEAFESAANVAQQIRRQSVEKVAPPLHQTESARNAQLKAGADAVTEREHEHCQLALSFDAHQCEVEEKELARRISAGYDHEDLSLGKDASVAGAGASTGTSSPPTEFQTKSQTAPVAEGSSTLETNRRGSHGKASQLGDKIKEKASKAVRHSDVQVERGGMEHEGNRGVTEKSTSIARESVGKAAQLGDKIKEKAAKAVGNSGIVHDERDVASTTAATGDSTRRGSEGKAKQLGDKILGEASNVRGHSDTHGSNVGMADRGAINTSSIHDPTHHDFEGKAEQIGDKPSGAAKAVGHSTDSHEGPHYGLQNEPDRDVSVLKQPPAGSLGPSSNVSEVSGPTSPSTYNKYASEESDRAPPLGTPASPTARGRRQEGRTSSVDHSEAGIGAVVTGIAGAAGSAHSSEAGKDHHHVVSQHQHSASGPTSPIKDSVHYKTEEIKDKAHLSKERRKSGGGFALARSKLDDKRKEKSHGKDMMEKDLAFDKHVDKKVPLGQKIKSFIKGDKPVSSEHTALGGASNPAVAAAGAAFAKPHVPDISSPTGLAGSAGGAVHEASGIGSPTHLPTAHDPASVAGSGGGAGGCCMKEVEYAHHQGIIQSPPSAHHVGKFSFEKR